MVKIGTMRNVLIFFTIMLTDCMADNEQLETVDLTGNMFRPVVTKSWLGTDVSSVLDVDNISKVVLLKAITSASTSLDIHNILGTIEKSTQFESLIPDLYKQIIWQALLVTNTGEYILYESNGEWAHITLESGGGSFRWSRERL